MSFCQQMKKICINKTNDLKYNFKKRIKRFAIKHLSLWRGKKFTQNSVVSVKFTRTNQVYKDKSNLHLMLPSEKPMGMLWNTGGGSSGGEGSTTQLSILWASEFNNTHAELPYKYPPNFTLFLKKIIHLTLTLLVLNLQIRHI